MNLSKHFKTANWLTTVVLAIAVCLGFTACSSDDDDEAASEIVGTWIMDDDVSITFKENNTGYIIMPVDDDDDYALAKSLTRAAQTQTINFTYRYNASAHTITMTANGETETWTGVSVIEGVFYATDSDGDRITAVKQGTEQSGTTDDDDALCGSWKYVSGNGFYLRDGEKDIYNDSGEMLDEIKIVISKNSDGTYSINEYYYDNGWKHSEDSYDIKVDGTSVEYAGPYLHLTGSGKIIQLDKKVLILEMKIININGEEEDYFKKTYNRME